MHHFLALALLKEQYTNYWKHKVKFVDCWSDEMSRLVTDEYRLYRLIRQYTDPLTKQPTNQLLRKIIASLPFGSINLEM